MVQYPVASGEADLQRAQRQLQAMLGKRRAARQDGIDIIQTKNIAPHQTGGFGGAVATQRRRPGIRRGRVQDGHRDRLDAVVNQQLRKQGGLPGEGVDCKLTGGRHSLQACESGELSGTGSGNGARPMQLAEQLHRIKRWGWGHAADNRTPPAAHPSRGNSENNPKKNPPRTNR